MQPKTKFSAHLSIRRTKIIATLGPASSSIEMIDKLMKAGVNVFRLNLSHGSLETHRESIHIIKRLRQHYSHPIGIMLDTKGAEIRIGEIAPLSLHEGQVLRLVKHKQHENDIPVIPSSIIDEIEEGKKILIDDGYIQGVILKKGDGYVEFRAENDGILKKNKSLCVLNQTFSWPDITDNDIQDIRFGCREGVDMIAASFVRTPKQIHLIRDLLHKEKKERILIIAKIEDQEGISHFPEILDIADGIMVARGDLGIQLFVGHVPILQKKMVRACNYLAKPVIVATQMLESMMNDTMPTRAEASDIANAIFDGATAVMLSGETAMGKYPLQTVKMMHELIIAAETGFPYKEHFHTILENDIHDVPSSIAKAAVTTSYMTQASAIVVCSNSGSTIRRIARFRPKANILALTPSEETYYQTSLYWGTMALLDRSMKIDFPKINHFILKHELSHYGDFVIYTLGKKYGISFTTNTLMVESIGDVLVRGLKAPLQEKIASIHGEVVHLLMGETKAPSHFVHKIVVIGKIHETHIPFLEGASAIIVQNPSTDKQSEEIVQQIYERKKIPYLTRADGAFSLLKEGEKVRFDPSLGIVLSENSPTQEEILAYSS